MALAMWNTRDALPVLEPLEGFSVEVCENDLDMAWINDLPIEDVIRRREQGNQAFVAYVNSRPVAYGWVATREVEIGELGLRFTLPEGDAYCWDFVTAPAWRGRGIYPRLLQSIMSFKATQDSRLWILYAPENVASASGIRRAGFEVKAEMSFLPDGIVALAGSSSSNLASTAATFGVEATTVPLSPCWCCYRSDDSGHECVCACTSGGGCTCSKGCASTDEERLTAVGKENCSCGSICHCAECNCASAATKAVAGHNSTPQHSVEAEVQS